MFRGDAVTNAFEAEIAETRLDRAALATHQRRKLAALLEVVCRSNPFYQRKLAGAKFDPATDPLDALPLTTRDELQRDQLDNPPFGTNLTEPPERFVRMHQSSGSMGTPLRWLDTPESWAWWLRCWRAVLRAAGVGAADRILFPFSFGPFIGFWSAFDAAESLGALCLPAGGMTTAARLRYLLDNHATAVCCTPTYALHMAEEARQRGIDLAGSAVRALIVAGEPGGCIPAVRARIETAWGAHLYDHAGMTEVGAWSFQLRETPTSLLVLESEFIAEVIDPRTLAPLPEGETGELVLTNLGRVGSPSIRLRTGDQVRLMREGPVGGFHLARAVDGVLGRLDDMIIVRGMNVFPAAIEGILREFGEIAEFRIHADRRATLAELVVEIEPAAGGSADALTERVGRALRDRLNFRPDVRLAAPGSLPRFELKARRVVRGEEKHRGTEAQRYT